MGYCGVGVCSRRRPRQVEDERAVAAGCIPTSLSKTLLTKHCRHHAQRREEEDTLHIVSGRVTSRPRLFRNSQSASLSVPFSAARRGSWLFQSSKALCWPYPSLESVLNLASHCLPSQQEPRRSWLLT